MQTRFLRKRMDRLFHALMLITLFSWGGYLSASAQGTGTSDDIVLADGAGTKDDPYVLGNGLSFIVESYKGWYAKFTASSDGTLFLSTTDSYAVYTDETFSTIDQNKTVKFNDSFTNPLRYFECTAGTTYYIGNYFVMNGGTVTAMFTGSGEAVDLKLLNVSPEAGSVFDVSTGTVSLEFNQSVSVGSVTMVAGSTTKSFSANSYGAYASVDAKATLMELYGDGSLNEGDDITFTFESITATIDGTTLYNGDGVYTISYKAGPKPLQLTATTNTEGTFYSYYTSDDQSGIVTLTFDGDVNTTDAPKAKLLYGNQEQEGEYAEVPLTVQNMGGNMLMINLKGVKRRPTDLLPSSGTTYGTIALKVYEVKDEAGNYAYSDGAGSLGSYTFTYTYENVEYNPETDWDPISGDIDNDTKSVNLWLKETGKKATITGAQVTYTNKGEEKTQVASYTVTNDADDADARNVTISLSGISADEGSELTATVLINERPDGVTIEEEPTALDIFTKTFNVTSALVPEKFEVTSAVWNNGTEEVNLIDGTVDVLTKGTTAVIKTNKDSEIGYVEWTLKGWTPDEGEGQILRSGYSSSLEEGLNVSWYNETLYSGHSYTFTINAWSSEEASRTIDPEVATFTINGSAVAYEYSDVVLKTDISEDFVLYNNADDHRTIEFSAPVTLEAVVNLGFGTSVDCTVEDINGDGTAWTITFPMASLTGYDMFDVNVFAKDLEGKAVNKTENGLGVIMGSGDDTWFELHFVADFNKPDMTVTPEDGSTVESIDRVTFTYESGISPNWGNTDGLVISVYNKGTREVIQEFTMDDVTYPVDWNDISNVYIVLKEPITEPGTYEVTVPSGFFILGEDQTAQTNKLTTITYVIAGEVPPSDITVVSDPAEGKVTEIPAEILLTFTEMSSVGYDDNKAPTLVDGNGNSYSVSYGWPTDPTAAWNIVAIFLNDVTSITTDGTYTLTIPKNALNFNDDPDNVNESPIVITWTIGTSTAIDNIVAAAGGKVNVYNVNGVQVLRDADATAVKTLRKGLYIINGKKVILK